MHYKSSSERETQYARFRIPRGATKGASPRDFLYDQLCTAPRSAPGITVPLCQDSASPPFLSPFLAQAAEPLFKHFSRKLVGWGAAKPRQLMSGRRRMNKECVPSGCRMEINAIGLAAAHGDCASYSDKRLLQVATDRRHVQVAPRVRPGIACARRILSAWSTRHGTASGRGERLSRQV